MYELYLQLFEWKSDEQSMRGTCEQEVYGLAVRAI